jgi:nucleoside 2-deoxyribosyltransferase
MLTIYLSGPIVGRADDECVDWREHVKSVWSGRTLDPLRRGYRGREEECADEIVEYDKIDIACSDAVLVNYDKPSVGTSMEVFLAFNTGKLVVIVTKQGTSLSPWLKYHSHTVVHTFEEALFFISEKLA